MTLQRIGLGKNYKDVIWIHAASVGEVNSVSELISHLSKKENILLTTSTIGGKRLSQKLNVRHEYVPWDFFLFIFLFLKRCKPKLALLVESEWWPSIIYMTKCPIISVNTRMSFKSFERRNNFRFLWRAFLDKISFFTPQSKSDLDKLKHFVDSKKIIHIGNLKYSCKKLHSDYFEKSNFTFLAASIHPEEEEDIEKIFPLFPKVIVAPRHITRSEFLKKSWAHIKNITVVDTLGNLGTYFNIADIVFIGGSKKRGGHNPIEPAHFGCAIIIGPKFENFKEIVDEMLEQDAIIVLDDMKNLSKVALSLFHSNQKRIQMGENAKRHLAQNNILEMYLELIAKFI